MLASRPAAHCLAGWWLALADELPAVLRLLHWDEFNKFVPSKDQGCDDHILLQYPRVSARRGHSQPLPISGTHPMWNRVLRGLGSPLLADAAAISRRSPSCRRRTSGRLHMGRADHTLIDAMSLPYAGLRGPVAAGFDHAGIATRPAWNPTEKRESKDRFDWPRGVHRARLGWKDEYGLIQQQMRAIGDL